MGILRKLLLGLAVSSGTIAHAVDCTEEGEGFDRPSPPQLPRTTLDEAIGFTLERQERASSEIESKHVLNSSTGQALTFDEVVNELKAIDESERHKALLRFGVQKGPAWFSFSPAVTSALTEALGRAGVAIPQPLVELPASSGEEGEEREEGEASHNPSSASSQPI